MVRLQATLVDQTGNDFSIRVLNVDTGASYNYSIIAENADKAAMEAMRRVEALDEKLNAALRMN